MFLDRSFAKIAMYVDMYSHVKKQVEESGDFFPFATLLTFEQRIKQRGKRILDLEKISLPMHVKSGEQGSIVQIGIHDHDEESFAESIKVVNAVARKVEAYCIGTALYASIASVDCNLALPRQTSDPKVERTIQFLFQAKDGVCYAQVPIRQKRKKIRLPNSAPPLHPDEVLLSMGKIF